MPRGNYRGGRIASATSTDTRDVEDRFQARVGSYASTGRRRTAADYGFGRALAAGSLSERGESPVVVSF